MTLTEYGQLTRVLLKHPRDAFRDEATIAAEWQALNFTAPPDMARAIDEYERFVAILRSAGAEIHFLPKGSGTTLDSLYARDASIVSSRGLISCSMGKRSRATEGSAQVTALASMGLDAIGVAGAIEGDGRLEGGDVIWLDDR